MIKFLEEQEFEVLYAEKNLRIYSKSKIIWFI
jgi:hypothetical protein